MRLDRDRDGVARRGCLEGRRPRRRCPRCPVEEHEAGRVQRSPGAVDVSADFAQAGRQRASPLRHLRRPPCARGARRRPSPGRNAGPVVVQSSHHKEPVDFVHSELTFQPGDATPWHYHPGPTLVTVKEGEITFTTGGCTGRTYHAGDSFVEGQSGLVGRAQNTGSTIARVNVVFIVPVGSATTFPVTPVACP